MLTADQVAHYQEHGYVVLDILCKQKLANLRGKFARMIARHLEKCMPEIVTKANQRPDPEEHLLHFGMRALDRHDHSLLVEIYNTLPRSSAYFQVPLCRS